LNGPNVLKSLGRTGLEDSKMNWSMHWKACGKRNFLTNADRMEQSKMHIVNHERCDGVYLP
jgi:hypothetical protein